MDNVISIGIWRRLKRDRDIGRKAVLSDVKTAFTFTSALMFFLLYRHADEDVFDDFPKISYHLPKISEDFLKARRTFPNIFREFSKISEDVRRFPKIAEDFPGRPEDVSMIHQWI